MNASLAVATFVAVGAVVSLAVVLAAPAAQRGRVTGLATVIVGAGGVALGVSAISSGFPAHHVAWLLPFAGITLGGGATAGLFAAVIGAVAIPVGLFTIGYQRRAPMPTAGLACLPVFVAAMILVPFAASVSTFLFVWELMALTSTVLVLAEHQHARARSAGQVYVVMTQLGFVLILIGLVVFAGAAGGDTFDQLRAQAQSLSPATRTAIFLLTFAGFGSKAGLLPLHAWLPRAHPEAPSPVSALMSAAMVNLGIYGIVRFDLVLLGAGPRWWALVLLAIGGVTAAYAVLQATVATDLKRLLAYSTCENMGLVTMALGAGLLLQESGSPLAGQIAFAAAALHVANHAAFKTLGFLSAGAVLAATGLRDLDRLGGLARTMPTTTAFFGVAAIGASGLPLGAGFVSEWLLFQSLIHAPSASGTALALVMPLSVGVVALTAGLGVAAMAKAFGVGFLARARSDSAACASEVSLSMRLAMGTAAAACVVLALAAGVLAPAIRAVLGEFPGGSAGPGPSLGFFLRLPGVSGSLSPGLLALAFAGALVVVVAVTRIRSKGRPATVSAHVWTCGSGRLTPRMQYTATSFAEPLQRVFTNVLRPDEDIEITHIAESRYLVEKIRYRSEIVDAIEGRLYVPVLRGISWGADLVRRGHQGSVHTYLAYGGLGLLAFLVFVR